MGLSNKLQPNLLRLLIFSMFNLNAITFSILDTNTTTKQLFLSALVVIETNKKLKGS